MKTQVQIKDCLNLLLLSLGPKNKITQLQRNHPQWQKHVWARKLKQTSLALLAHANVFCVAFLAHLYVHCYPCLNTSTFSFCSCHPKLNLFEDLLVVGAVEGLFPTQQNVPAEAGRKFQVVHQIDCLKFTWQKVVTSSHIIWLPFIRYRHLSHFVKGFLLPLKNKYSQTSTKPTKTWDVSSKRLLRLPGIELNLGLCGKLWWEESRFF